MGGVEGGTDRCCPSHFLCSGALSSGLCYDSPEKQATEGSSFDVLWKSTPIEKDFSVGAALGLNEKPKRCSFTLGIS